MKTYTIRLSKVEEEMLKEIQKGKKSFLNLEVLMRNLIRDEYTSSQNK